MNLFFLAIQNIVAVFAAAVLTERFGLFKEKSGAKAAILKSAAQIGAFSAVSLYGTAAAIVFGIGGIDTKIIGAALAGLCGGFLPAMGTALVASLVSLAEGGKELIPNIIALLITAAACGALKSRLPKYNPVWYGIIAAGAEIIRAVLILIIIRPTEAATEIVFNYSFVQILLGGISAGIFALTLGDMLKRKEKLKKEADTRAEADSARKVQGSLLKNDFPCDSRLDFFAAVQSAMGREGEEKLEKIGGDFYDYIISGDRFTFIIGDVSENGVAASLLTARTIMLFRLYGKRLSDTAEIAAQISNTLCGGSSSSGFAAAAIGVFDLTDGSLMLTSAGFPAPLVTEAGKTAEAVSVLRGLPLGVKENAEYKSIKLSLKKGQYLLFYGNGISDAESKENGRFGAGRIVTATSDCHGLNSERLCQRVLEAVNLFTGNTEQEDDYSLLSISFNPAAGKRHKIGNTLYEASVLADELPAELEEAGLSKKLANTCAIIADGVITDIIKYGYPNFRAGNIILEADISGKSPILIISDDGECRDPLSAKPKADSNIENMGGISLGMVKSRISGYSYDNENGMNKLTIKVRSE